jgi:hypothetical protein
MCCGWRHLVWSSSGTWARQHGGLNASTKRSKLLFRGSRLTSSWIAGLTADFWTGVLAARAVPVTPGRMASFMHMRMISKFKFAANLTTRVSNTCTRQTSVQTFPIQQNLLQHIFDMDELKVSKGSPFAFSGEVASGVARSAARGLFSPIQSPILLHRTPTSAGTHQSWTSESFSDGIGARSPDAPSFLSFGNPAPELLHTSSASAHEIAESEFQSACTIFSLRPRVHALHSPLRHAKPPWCHFFLQFYANLISVLSISLAQLSLTFPR